LPVVIALEPARVLEQQREAKRRQPLLRNRSA
jgi:hypothetical protein